MACDIPCPEVVGLTVGRFARADDGAACYRLSVVRDTFRHGCPPVVMCLEYDGPSVDNAPTYNNASRAHKVV